MITITQQAVSTQDRGRNVTVSVSDESITVQWVCGDSRTFRAEQVGQLIENIDLSAGTYDGMPMAGKDRYDSRFAVAIKDGRLHADTDVRGSLAGYASVEWRELRRALKRALRQVEKLAEAETSS